MRAEGNGRLHGENGLDPVRPRGATCGPAARWADDDADMKIPFYKMHGAANDFILVDDRAQTFPMRDRPWLARIAARRTGVGCEGIILIQPSARASFRMRFINPDGGEAEMCGNGARCVARLAHDLGVAPDRMTIETGAGLLHAEILEARVRLRMTDPRDWRLGQTLVTEGRTFECDSVNSGVPHVVIRTPDLDGEDVRRFGRALRYHADFQPAGTNVNFVQIAGPDAIRIRTYERGVEDETLACGTGMVAAGLVAARRGWAGLPVRLLPASGDALEVAGRAEGERWTDVTLTGPAEHVFEGVLTYLANRADGGKGAAS